MDLEQNQYSFNTLEMPPRGEIGQEIIELDRDYFPIPWSENAWLEGHGRDYLLLGCFKENRSKGSSPYGLVGFCLFRTLVGDPQAHLLKILIDPDYRGQKLGLSLLRLAKETLKDQGFKEIFLEVKGSNVAAIKLYKKEGFQVVHKVSGYYGEQGDGVMMLCSI